MAISIALAVAIYQALAGGRIPRHVVAPLQCGVGWLNPKIFALLAGWFVFVRFLPIVFAFQSSILSDPILAREIGGFGPAQAHRGSGAPPRSGPQFFFPFRLFGLSESLLSASQDLGVRRPF